MDTSYYEKDEVIQSIENLISKLQLQLDCKRSKFICEGCGAPVEYKYDILRCPYCKRIFYIPNN